MICGPHLLKDLNPLLHNGYQPRMAEAILFSLNQPEGLMSAAVIPKDYVTARACKHEL
jgi:hypothetical protein